MSDIDDLYNVELLQRKGEALVKSFTIPAYDIACFASHMGLWHIEPAWFNRAFASVRSGILRPLSVTEQEQRRARAEGFQLLDNGTAIVSLHGHMTKAGDSFGAGSTVRTRQALRSADRDQAVHRIMLHIDSPGGHVAGVDDLASDVRRIDQHKPVYAHIDDLGASAAYYVASQARRITANQGAEVGSIGTLLVVEDFSELAEMKGIKVHVVSTGAYKGAGILGTEITEQHLAYFQDRVDALNGLFLDAVRSGRGLEGDRLQAVTDGRVFIAEKAQQLGLIDAVQPFDAALHDIQQSPMRGQNMSAKDALQSVWQAMGGKGKVEVSEEPEPEARSDTGALEKLADVLGMPCSVLTHDIAMADFTETTKLYNAQLEKVHAEGRKAGITQGTDDGRKEGYATGRLEAFKIAAHCQVAECSDKTHIYLDVKDDGSCMSFEAVRAVVESVRVESGKQDEIASQVLPGGAQDKDGTARPMESAEDIYARRRGQA